MSPGTDSALGPVEDVQLLLGGLFGAALRDGPAGGRVEGDGVDAAQQAEEDGVVRFRG